MRRPKCVDGTYLGNGNGLLFHDLVDGGTVTFGHFVELIDAANALVGQHECAALQNHLVGERVLHDGGRQTDARRPTAGGVLAAHGQAIDVAQQLRFRHTRVAHQANVDVATDPHAVRPLIDATDQQQQQRLLHVQVAENFRRNGAGQARIEVVLRQFVQLFGG